MDMNVPLHYRWILGKDLISEIAGESRDKRYRLWGNAAPKLKMWSVKERRGII